MSQAKIDEIARRLTSIETGLVAFETKLGSIERVVSQISAVLDGAATTPARRLRALDEPARKLSRTFTLMQEGHNRVWLLFHEVEVAASMKLVDVARLVPRISERIRQGMIVLAEVDLVSAVLVTRGTPNIPLALDQIGVELEFRVVVLPNSPNSRTFRPKVALIAAFTPDSGGTGTLAMARGLRIIDEATLRTSMRPPKVFTEFKRVIREHSSRMSTLGTIRLPVPTEIPGYEHPMTLRGGRIGGDAANPFISLFARLEHRPRAVFPFLPLAGETADIVLSVWGDLILNRVVDTIQSEIADVTLVSHSYNSATRSIDFRLRREQNKKKRIFGKRVGAKCISEATFSVAFSSRGGDLVATVSRISGVDTDIDTSPGGFGKYFKFACSGSYAAFNAFPETTQDFEIDPRIVALAAVIEDNPGRLEVQASFS